MDTLQRICQFEQVGFEVRFEWCDSVRLPDVRREGVPKPGSSAAERPSSHGAEAGGGGGQKTSWWWAQGTGGGVLLKEVSEVGGGEVEEGFVGEQKVFEINPVLNREPVKLDENGGHLVGGHDKPNNT